jgi:hypothetical protein
MLESDYEEEGGAGLDRIGEQEAGCLAGRPAT